MLSLRALGKDFGDRVAVRSLDLDVTRGECFALVGPEGAGKTTVLSMIGGVVTPTRGTVTVAGADVHADPFTAKVLLGFVPQDVAVYDELTAIQNVRYVGALSGLGGSLLVERARSVLAAVGLASQAHERVETFSNGLKRRLNIASALVHQPKLVVLDEPIAEVDAETRARIIDVIHLLKRAGTTVVCSSQIIEDIESLCDRIALVEHGEIVALGTVLDLRAAHRKRGPR